MGAAEGGVCAAKGGLIAVEGVMAVALGDLGGGETALFAHHLLALAWTRDPEAGGGNDADKANSIADGTDSHQVQG